MTEEAAQRLFAAAKVIQLTPAIKKWLTENDPMALKQLDGAIRFAERQSVTKDELLAAIKVLWRRLDNVYDVDEPEPGHRREYPYAGAGEDMEMLSNLIARSEVV